MSCDSSIKCEIDRLALTLTSYICNTVLQSKRKRRGEPLWPLAKGSFLFFLKDILFLFCGCTESFSVTLYSVNILHFLTVFCSPFFCLYFSFHYGRYTSSIWWSLAAVYILNRVTEELWVLCRLVYWLASLWMNILENNHYVF